jgi:hypothetical protein
MVFHLGFMHSLLGFLEFLFGGLSNFWVLLCYFFSTIGLLGFFVSRKVIFKENNSSIRLGIPCFFKPPTTLGGASLVCAGIVYLVAAFRKEKKLTVDQIINGPRPS